MEYTLIQTMAAYMISVITESQGTASHSTNLLN